MTLWDEDYVNQTSIDEFAAALVSDTEDDPDTALEMATRSSQVLRIVLKLDWAPVPEGHKKKAKRAAKRLRNEFRLSALYHLLRWPLLIVIGVWIVILTALYSIVRAYVALLEYFFTWVGEQKRLRDRLRAATTFDEWRKAALDLDHYLRYDKWLLNPRFSYYDYRTVLLTIATLRKYREAHNHYDMMVVLQGCLKTNFAGIENRQLYSHRYYGTKNLVDEYVDEVVRCVDVITAADDIASEDRAKFFKIVSKNYGKTALALSGGACFAYMHFGIVKALLENDLLPDIISGTLGGGLIAALACTYTDDELRELLVPELADKITACEDPWYVWMPRLLRTGARFDAVKWAAKLCFFTRGDTTFQEAYERTGRHLNVLTVPADPHLPVILCNNITLPNCIVWSLLIALAAVPGILNPVVLMMKNRDQVQPFSLGNKWRDGLLRTDIPLDALNNYYNVNFSVVSQVNPHISLFFFAPKGTVGRPVARRRILKGRYLTLRGGFIATALEQLFKLEITQWLQMIKTLDILPHFLEQDWLNIWLQRFTGSMTIWPRIRLKDFWYILLDPTREQFAEMLMKGERSMYPRILFLSHRLSIERAIGRGRAACRMLTKITSSLPLPGVDPATDFQFHAVQYDDDDDIEATGGIPWQETAESDSKDESYFEDTDTNTSSDSEDEDPGQNDDEPVRGFINEVLESANNKYTEITHRRNTIF